MKDAPFERKKSSTELKKKASATNHYNIWKNTANHIHIEEENFVWFLKGILLCDMLLKTWL